MRIVSYIFLLAIILLGATFAVLNSGVVTINYYVGQRSLPLSLLLALVFAAGCLLGIAVTSWALLKIKLQNHHLQKQLKIAEKEVENLRAIPLQVKEVQ